MKAKYASRPRSGARHIAGQLLWWIVAASVVAVPLIYAPAGEDGFRIPKELLLRASALLIAAALITIAIFDKPRALLAALPRGRVALVLAAIAAVTLIATAASTNRLLSVDALAYTATLLVFFVGAFVALGRQEPARALAIALLGAVPNAILAVLQRTSIWNPFYLDEKLSAHIRTSALLGNANDVGSFLMPIAVMTAAWTLLTRRAWWWLATAVVVVGLMASESLSAIAGFFAGCAVLLFILPRRTKLLRVAAIAVVVVAIGAAATVGRSRLETIRVTLAARDYPSLTSQRIFPFATAWEIFTDRPLIGAGPGTFKFHYLAYRLRFNERHPWWIYAGGENYGQVHNDHLQVLAEEGVIGYAVFVAALLLVASKARRPDADAPAGRATFARVAALPLAVSFAVMALGAFPLELAAASQTIAYFAAAILRWSDDEVG